MCKKSKKVTCTPKHIVDKMLKQLRIEGGKENGDKNVGDNKEATLAKADDKVKENGKSSLRGKDNKNKKRET
jgi:hypothetical protein